MQETIYCPCCRSSSINSVKTVRFNFPGNNVQDNLQDIPFVRKWILFKKILKSEQSAVFRVMLCRHCGFLFLNPRLTEGEIKLKYQTTNELGDVKMRYNLNPLRNSDKRALRIYSLVNKYFPGELKNKKILDYGGSWGYNLYPFIERNNECFILDYEKWGYYEKGIKYIGHEFTSLERHYLFDVMLILHTLEHIADPHLFLEQAVSHLNEGGLIYVEVPLGAFHEYSHLRDPITHLNFFSEESIVKLFQSMDLGVVHISTKNQWVTTSRGLCINVIGIKKRDKGINRKINFKTTYYQMRNYAYYLQLILNKLISGFRLIK